MDVSRIPYIDEECIGALQALNDAGLETTESCAGWHWTQESPYQIDEDALESFYELAEEEEIPGEEECFAHNREVAKQWVALDKWLKGGSKGPPPSFELVELVAPHIEGVVTNIELFDALRTLSDPHITRIEVWGGQNQHRCAGQSPAAAVPLGHRFILTFIPREASAECSKGIWDAIERTAQSYLRSAIR